MQAATPMPAPRLRRLLIPGALLLAGAAIGFAVAVVRPGWPSPTALVLSELSGEPMDVEIKEGAGYATLFEGSVVRIQLAGDRITWTEAAGGLEHPRGLALGEDSLFVVESGALPCVSEPGCPEDPAAREIANITASNARILVYPITTDGALGEPRTLLDGIPVVGRDHSANDLDLGPDGMLYLALGGVDQLWRDPSSLHGVDHRHLDWLGTVLRIDPHSGEASVWARGLRNVYGLAFSPDGRLFGVDNDGPTLRGWRQEELLELVEGADYGYPAEGSFGPFAVRTGFPIYALAPGGHAGIAWVGDGVAAGSCGRLDRVPLIDRDGEYEVGNRVLIKKIASLDGCVTSIVPAEGGLLVAAFGVSGVYFVPDP